MKVIILSLGLSILAGCGGKAPAKHEEQSQRSCEGVVCTMMFTTITVEVRDAKGNAVELDEAYTLVSKSGQRIPIEQHVGNGRYVVLDDSYLKQLQNRTDEFRFVGMKNGARVVEETYTISADCCHVKMENGKGVIVVQ